MSAQWTAPEANASKDPRPASDAAAGHGSPGPTAASRELVERAPLFPLRPLGLGEILGAATRVYRLRPRTVLLVSAAVFAVVFALSTVVSGASMLPLVGSLQTAFETDAATPPESTPGETLAIFTGTFAASAISLIGVQLVTVPLIDLTLGEATGRPRSDREAWRSLRRHGAGSVLVGILASLLGLGLAVLAVLLGSLPLLIVQTASAWTVTPLLVGIGLGILAAVWIFGRTCLATPALVAEGIGPIAALRRGFALTRGRRQWRVLGIALLLTVLASILMQVLGGVVGTVAMVAYIGILAATQFTGLLLAMSVLLVLTMLGGYIASVLVQPFLSAGSAVLYADQRMRHEAWDIELTRAASAAREGVPGHDTGSAAPAPTGARAG